MFCIYFFPVKFGKRLQAQADECPWLVYLDYAGLKKVIAICAEQAPEYAVEHFQDCLKNEISKVNLRFVIELQKPLGRMRDLESNIAEEVSNRVKRLVSLSQSVETLRRYAVHNMLAVGKIVKKFKKVLGIEETLPVEQQPVFQDIHVFLELGGKLDAHAHLLASHRIASHDRNVTRDSATKGEPSRERACPVCRKAYKHALKLICGHEICVSCVLSPQRNEGDRDMSVSTLFDRCPVCSHGLSFGRACALTITSTDDSSACCEAHYQYSFDTMARGQWRGLEDEGATQNRDISGNVFCTVCCEPLALEATVETSCHHVFHKLCLQTSHRKPECPLCSLPLNLDLVVAPRHQQRLKALGGSFAVCRCESHEFKCLSGPVVWACVRCGGWSMDALPPVHLVGRHISGGLLNVEKISMRSYIHYASRASLRRTASSSEAKSGTSLGSSIVD